MSYYYDKKIYDTYKISELFNTNTSLTKDVIEICNNEDFNIDLSQCTFKSNLNGVYNVELNKVIIDWGDGEVTKLIRPIQHTISTISNVKENTWKKTTHTFNIDKRNIYLTNDVSFLPKIQIKLYSTFNDVAIISIPYKIVYKSLYDLGTNFELLQANVANNNLTQFVLKEGVNDSITIVSAKDWKKIYGDSDEINYIEDNKISIDYSDEYIDYDNIVWDWNAVPYVDIYDMKVDKTNQLIKCYFSQKNVILDEWTPNCEKLLDSGNISYDKESNENVKDGNYFECKFNDSLDNSLFRIYLDVKGINGVTGKSEYFYVASSSNFAERITSLTAVSIPSDNNNVYQFNLSSNVQWKHLKSAKMILKPIRWAASTSMYSPEVREIGLTTTDNFSSSEYEDSDVTYSFEYDITKDGVIIDPYSLPNGKYQISYNIKDLLGNKKEEVTGGATEHKIYVDSSNIPAPVISNFPSTNELIEIKWTVTSDKQDKTALKVTNSTVGIVANIKEPYNSNKNIIHSVNDNVHTYSYTIDGNTIPDGTYKVCVGNCIDMSDFVGCRQNVAEKDIAYTYPSPKINIKSINTYPKWNATTKTWNPYLRLSVDDSGRVLKNVILQYGENNTLSYNLNQSNIYDVPLSAVSNIGSGNYDTCKIGASYDSDLYNRIGYGQKYSIKKTGEIDSLFTNVPTLVDDSLDLSQYYKNELTQAINVPGTTVQQESAFDVNKKYVISYDEKIINSEGEEETITKKCYSPVNVPKFYTTNDKPGTNNDKPVWYVYRPIEYTDESNTARKITRFFNDGSVIINDDKNPVCIELESVATYLGRKNISVKTEYDKLTDTSILKFSCTQNKLGEAKDIQYAYLDLYNSSGTKIFRQDVRNGFDNTVTSMLPDKYTGEILFSSVNTSNMKTNAQGIDESSLDAIRFNIDMIDALVPASQAISSSATSKTNINNNDYYDVVISYTIYHKSFESLKLVYKIGDDKEKSVGLNTINSSSYELPEQIAPGTKVKYYILGISPKLKNGNSSTGIRVGKNSYEYQTPIKS